MVNHADRHRLDSCDRDGGLHSDSYNCLVRCDCEYDNTPRIPVCIGNSILSLCKLKTESDEDSGAESKA
jgi:hypothetical protein